MHIHILGIGGTFMGGLAVLASELGITVTGSDQKIYPPMSEQLGQLGIKVHQGYDAKPLDALPEYVVVGNVMSRGMPIIETLLAEKIPFLSGPEWLSRFVLQKRTVLAVSGTHGKTTTTSMLAWILDFAGLNPGFLIGGVPNNFGVSARLGSDPYFIVEADEYDSAFFDKRSKFVHYQPHVLVINNIEFDHADIFADLSAIQTQFHHLVRVVSGEGLIVCPSADRAVFEVLEKGCWTKTTTFDSTPLSSGSYNKHGWAAQLQAEDASHFEVFFEGKSLGKIQWALTGEHNVRNALAAIAAASGIGIEPELSTQALSEFTGVKRRLELKGEQGNVRVFDDFAHHPTAIETTLSGLRAQVGDKRIIAAVDLRSNTMRSGYHQETLAQALLKADSVYFFHGDELDWDVKNVWEMTKKPGGVYTDVQALLQALLDRIEPNDQVVFMSNGGFGGIQETFLSRLADLEKLMVLGGF